MYAIFDEYRKDLYIYIIQNKNNDNKQDKNIRFLVNL